MGSQVSRADRFADRGEPPIVAPRQPVQMFDTPTQQWADKSSPPRLVESMAGSQEYDEEYIVPGAAAVVDDCPRTALHCVSLAASSATEYIKSSHRHTTVAVQAASPPMKAVNHLHNVDNFMLDFFGDLDKMLQYCFVGGVRRSIALCFVDRLTRSDREASGRADCVFFSHFSAAQHAYYFRLVPLTRSAKTRAFAVEYYATANYEQLRGVFGMSDWIKFEALLRLFFHRGFQYLMKVFPTSHKCGRRSAVAPSLPIYAYPTS